MTKREMRMGTADFKIERAEGAAPKIVGYAARFNEVTQIGPWFREKIAPGAFAEVVKKDDVRALFNHDPNKVLGRTTAGTLKVFEDEAGLRYEITPPDTQEARDLMALLERGDVRESSFSFGLEAGDDEWDDDPDMPMRTIKRVSALYDVGPVTFPAYPTTTAGARSAEEIRADHEQARSKHEKNKREARDRKFRTMRKRLDLAALN
jgi:uncharacterized protein